jgi:hypothetical protein
MLTSRESFILFSQLFHFSPTILKSEAHRNHSTGLSQHRNGGGLQFCGGKGVCCDCSLLNVFSPPLNIAKVNCFSLHYRRGKRTGVGDDFDLYQ